MVRACACCKEETGVAWRDRHGNYWCPSCRGDGCSLVEPCKKKPRDALKMSRTCRQCGADVLVPWPDGKPPKTCEEHAA